jgi:hypothetical protein
MSQPVAHRCVNHIVEGLTVCYVEQGLNVAGAESTVPNISLW